MKKILEAVVQRQPLQLPTFSRLLSLASLQGLLTPRRQES
jgi:hypothetical protein